MKRTLMMCMVIAATLCAVDVRAQASSRRGLLGSRSRPTQSQEDSDRIDRGKLIRQVAEEIQGKGDIPDDELSRIASSGKDGASFYALAIVSIRHSRGSDQFVRDYYAAGQYMWKAAKLGYPNAEVAVALSFHPAGDYSVKESFLKELPNMQIVEMAYESESQLPDRFDLARTYYKKAIDHGYPCLTNMLVVLDQDLRKKNEEDLTKMECEARAKELKRAAYRGAGVTKPFVIFNELGKIEYPEAVAKAKENDANALYWLAYYFAKGGPVECNGNDAWKCLSKAADLGCPDANYAKGQLYEEKSFKGLDDKVLIRDEYLSIDTDKSLSIEKDADVAYVEELYNCAIAGGLTYATNDIARFRQKVSSKRAEIAAQNALHAKARDVIDALDQETKAAREAERAANYEKRAKEYKEKEAEQEFWKAWSEQIGPFEPEILRECENEFNVMWVTHNEADWTPSGGKGLIFEGSPRLGRGIFWIKCDSDGRIVKAGRMQCFSEYVWLTNRAAQATIERRKAWASDHNMTYEEAEAKYCAYTNNVTTTRSSSTRGGLLGDGRGGLGSLRERRALREQARAEEKATAEERARIAAEKEAQRDAELAAEREQREREREEQRAQLMQIQDELKKAREERERAK